MNTELQRLISNARTRLGDYVLSRDEAEENSRREAMEEFELLLGRKINVATHMQLLVHAEDVWRETGPAVRFKIDEHTFLLTRADGEFQLSQECNGELVQLARLAESDPSFQDRLLAAIGSVLDPMRN
jgi:hypothetical protein